MNFFLQSVFEKGLNKKKIVYLQRGKIIAKMAHITIKNIGPIKDVDIDLKKINVFMGAQSSGKSTIAKIICHCQWVEKKCFPAFGKEAMLLQNGSEFYDKMIAYHRMDGYFDNDSQFMYKGDYVTISYIHNGKKVSIEENNQSKYRYPKIVYIPSERNLVAAIPNLSKYNETNDAILYFMYDWFSARENLREMSLKSVLQTDIKYSYRNDRDYIVDGGKEILISNASSGVQSLTPLMMVLKNSIEFGYGKDKPHSYEQMIVKEEALQLLQYIGRAKRTNPDNFFSIMKRLAISIPNNDIESVISQYEKYAQLIDSVFDYHLTNIFLEEPEQNLFPDTQIRFVYWLMKLLKKGNFGHRLTLTTHSPYILFSLNNCMMGGLVKNNIPAKDRESFDSSQAWINPKYVSIYEITDGTLRTIQDEDGIIEDNYLNQAYKANSAEYLSLLEYYDDEE